MEVLVLALHGVWATSIDIVREDLCLISKARSSTAEN